MWYLFVAIFAPGYPFATSQVLTFLDQEAAEAAGAAIKATSPGFVKYAVFTASSPSPPPTV